MREAAPLYRSELDGLWYVSTYAGAKAMLADPEIGMGAGRARYGVSKQATDQANTMGGSSMLQINPPEHTRLRALANKAFTARRVSE